MQKRPFVTLDKITDWEGNFLATSKAFLHDLYINHITKEKNFENIRKEKKITRYKKNNDLKKTV